MATNLDFITDALRELQVIPETVDPSPEQGTAVLRKLNDMMQQWTEAEIDIGWFVQTSTTDTCPVPDWARLAVKTNLAVAIAPQCGAVVSPSTAQAARDGYNVLLRKAIVEKMEGADMRHMPRGSGWRGGYDINTDRVL